MGNTHGRIASAARFLALAASLGLALAGWGCDSGSSGTASSAEAAADTASALVATITSPAATISVETGDVVAFAGQVSSTAEDADGSVTYTFAWEIPGGDPSQSGESAVDATFDAAGIYTATFTVTDSAGNTAIDTVTVTVADTTDPLAATITEPAGNIAIAAGVETVSFSGSGSGGVPNTDGTDAYSYAWDIQGGDPRTATTASVEATFEDAGETYTVTFTVTDSEGNAASDAVTITTY